MAKGDKTGPEGAGPKTGRGMGLCAGNKTAGFMNGPAGLGRGCGRGFMRGMGRRHGFAGAFSYAVTAVDEKGSLKNQAAALEAELKAVIGRMEVIEATDSM